MKLYLSLGLLALVLGLLAWGYKGKADTAKLRGQLTTVTDQRNATAKNLTRVEAEKAKLLAVSKSLTERLRAQAARNAEQQKALNEALKANPDWADTPVPDSVWDSITLRPSTSLAQPAGPRVDAGSGGAAAAGQDQRRPRGVGESPA